MPYARIALLVALGAIFAAGIVLERTDAQRGPLPSKRGGLNARGDIAGQFDYYALVLSWSPSYCETTGKKRRERQCDPRGRPYAFVLHGLWPQYERRWPQDCRIGKRPFVERSTINSMLDIMPSKGLIIHEYKKHGTCSGLDPDGYYRLARRLYNKIKIPARYVSPAKAMLVTPGELTRDFIAANRGLTARNFAISCRGSGKRLREIRFCFAKTGALRDCGPNENQRRLCAAKKMYVPPVRLRR